MSVSEIGVGRVIVGLRKGSAPRGRRASCMLLTRSRACQARGIIPPTMTAVAVRALDKSFGGLRVTSGVDLVVEPGERRLIIGPNGAGKTTLFNLITGELTPDRGSIALFD